ncbi:MAG: pantoate--beta-alanine ligase [Pirellulales bacterium]
MKSQVASELTTTLPRVVAEADVARRFVRASQAAGKTVGFVPTMGALHEGHLSLVDAARSECELVVVSIFVNPTQFGPKEDLSKYPRDLDRDLSLLSSRGCDLVFAPSVEEMYPDGYVTSVDVGALGRELEGEFRPDHFRGVATVVLKLFEIVPAEVAFFGRKDYQQTLVVERMITDLNVPIEIRVVPTVREPDGLAMSSRNAYLSAEDRRRALGLSQSLQLANELVRGGQRDVEAIRARMLTQLKSAGIEEVQYIGFVADGTITPVTRVDGPTTVAIAAKVGTTRLIDNVRIG